MNCLDYVDHNVFEPSVYTAQYLSSILNIEQDGKVRPLTAAFKYCRSMSKGRNVNDRQDRFLVDRAARATNVGNTCVTDIKVNT